MMRAPLLHVCMQCVLLRVLLQLRILHVEMHDPWELHVVHAPLLHVVMQSVMLAQ